MKLKMILSLLVSIAAFSAHASDECKREQAEKAVEEMCSVVETKDKDAAIQAVQEFRYCGTNYVWVQDSDVKMVAHPLKPKLVGKDLKEEKDNNGNGKKFLFVEFDKVAKKSAKGGWVDYLWPKPGAETPTEKISFVKLCKGDKKWIVGSGIWK